MTRSALAAKQDAARRAVELVQSGMVLGLGTGSTATLVVEALAVKLRDRELTDLVGIPTSTRTRELAKRLGVPLSTLGEHPEVDLTIDGADQVTPDGSMIKGGGGALLWEKIVATQTRRYVIVVDDVKMVDRLGVGFPLPVEVVAFGWKAQVGFIANLGAEVTLRTGRGDEPYRTDEGHFILDCHFAEGIADPAALDATFAARPGMVTTGLFVGFSPEVIVGRAGDDGARDATPA